MHEMKYMHSKYDNVHKYIMFYVLICINNHIIICINCMLSGSDDGYYVSYKSITLLSILFVYIEIKFIHCHFCVMFAMKSLNICNESINYDKIIIQ